MISKILWAFCVLSLILMFIALAGVTQVGLGWVGWLIAAVIFGVIAYFLSGGFPSNRV